jgi:hypothetical protein
MMRFALVLALSAAALVGETARTCDPVTGTITFKEKDSRRLGVRNPEGRIRTFTVDSAAMPKWFEEFQVGERVRVTCKDAGIERRPVATDLKAAPEEKNP